MYNNYSSPYYSRSYGKSNQVERDRPSTLNLGGVSDGTTGSSLIGAGSGSSSRPLGGSGNLGSGIGTSGGLSGNALGTSSSANMPNKPSRYTPSSASSAAAAAASSSSKLSSYTSNMPPSLTSSSYPSSYAPRNQEVITVPPRSTLTLGQSSHHLSQQHPLHSSSSSSSSHQPLPLSNPLSRYYSSSNPMQPISLTRNPQQQQQQQQHEVHLRQPQLSQQYQNVIVDRPMNTVTASKSTHNLIMDSIPDVFCLSCPPAEFKFSDAYRAKTLPRTGKEVSNFLGKYFMYFANFLYFRKRVSVRMLVTFAETTHSTFPG